VGFPQATVRQTILAVSTGALTLPDAFVSKSLSITYRGEGCHTLAISGRAKVDPTLQFLRYSLDFLPMFARRWRNLSPGGLQGALAGHESMFRWRLDRPTPMEAMRILKAAFFALAVMTTPGFADDTWTVTRDIALTSRPRFGALREEKIIRMRFGLEDGSEHTLEEVGQAFQVTRERIRQIEAKALRKLRHPSRSRSLRAFVDRESR